MQVAAYNNREAAEAEAARVSDIYGYATMVSPFEKGSETFYRVRLLVETREQAKSLEASVLEKSHVKAWIDPLQ